MRRWHAKWYTTYTWALGQGPSGGRGAAHLRAVLPHLRRAKVPQALVVEAVHLRDLPALVVAADHVDAVRVPDLQRDEQQECLQAVETTIHVVTLHAANVSASRTRAAGRGGRGAALMA